MAKKGRQVLSPIMLYGGMVVLELLAAILALIILTSDKTWYNQLVVPFFSPTPWQVAVAWIILYPLMAIAAYAVYNKNKGKKNMDAVFVFFGIAAILPILRGIFFWQLNDIVTSTAIEVVLWLVLIGLTMKFWRVSREAGALMTPVLLWVTFRLVVFIGILSLNGILLAIW